MCVEWCVVRLFVLDGDVCCKYVVGIWCDWVGLYGVVVIVWRRNLCWEISSGGICEKWSIDIVVGGWRWLV